MKLLKIKDTTLLIAPVSGDKYIYNERLGVLVSLFGQDGTIVDKTYSYDIQLSRKDWDTVERVFSQHNVRTVMGTAQAAGIALLVAAQNNIPVFLHTPSEVKAAVTGSGRANKSQVSEMVKRLLNLKEIPKPADSADALALAICHIWRGAGESKIKSALAAEKKRLATLR
jgi:crossover junction endodeoxyribonuclease RuvC